MPNPRATYFIESWTTRNKTFRENTTALPIEYLNSQLETSERIGGHTIAVFFLIPKKYRQPELFNN